MSFHSRRAHLWYSLTISVRSGDFSQLVLMHPLYKLCFAKSSHHPHCGAVTTMPCPRISQRNISTIERWDPSKILFYFFLVLLLHFAFVVIAVYMVLDSVVLIGLPLPGPSSFLLILRSWKPQGSPKISSVIVSNVIIQNIMIYHLFLYLNDNNLIL